MSLKIASIKEISSKYQNYFFDLDGVIWKGSQKIKGGVEALNYLRQNNKNIFFITNSSIRNRKMLELRFKQFGFVANYNQIFSSDYITSLYIQEKYPNLKKAIVIGKPNLVQQIKNGGLQVIHLTEGWSEQQQVQNLISTIDETIDTVVMGYDFHFNYKKLVQASIYIQNGCKFISTNPDKYTMLKNKKVPGLGSMVSSVQIATGIKSEVAGKPNTFILDHIIKSQKLNQQQCIMIGDNIETDIKFGKNRGIDTLCVLTGVSTQQMVLKDNQPKYYSEFLI